MYFRIPSSHLRLIVKTRPPARVLWRDGDHGQQLAAVQAKLENGRPYA